MVVGRHNADKFEYLLNAVWKSYNSVAIIGGDAMFGQRVDSSDRCLGLT